MFAELSDTFLDAHVEKLRGHAHKFNTTIGYLAESYGELAVNEFSPKKLKAVRNQIVKADTLCRNQINRYSRPK